MIRGVERLRECLARADPLETNATLGREFLDQASRSEAPGPLGSRLSVTFPVQARRTLPSLRVFAALGVLAAGAALINIAVTDAEAKQPWALLVLILGLPGIWIVFLCCFAVFSLRVTDERIEKLLVGRWAFASKPIADLRAASVVQNTLRMSFSDGSRLSLGAMPLRDLALLERTLRSRRSDLRLF